MHSGAARKNGQNNYWNTLFVFLWPGAKMVSANENCCINELIFTERSMLIERIIARYVDTHRSAVIRGTQAAFLTLWTGCRGGLDLRYAKEPLLLTLLQLCLFPCVLQEEL